jgi:hypothetical protein
VRDAEVDDDGGSVDEHDVGRLQVAVDDAGTVDRHQRVRQAGRHAPQRLDEPRDDVGPLGGHVGVQHLGDVRAAHAPHRVHLARKPAAEVGVRGQIGLEQLDRDLAPLVVESAAHHPHAALADELQEAVRTCALRLGALYRPHVYGISARATGGSDAACGTDRR